MNCRSCHTIITSLLLSILSTAQVPHYTFHEIGEAHQRAQFTMVYQTTDGFLWFGSDQGLFQYDGFSFKPYLVPDSLSNNEVSAIYEDARGGLWVGYQDGAIFHAGSSRQLKPWIIEEGWPKVPVTAFREGDDQVFWFSTYGEGIYYYQNQHLYNINTDDGLLGDDIYTMIKVDKNQMWVGTDGGISICALKNGKKTLEHITREEGLPDDIVRTMLPDSQGNLWVGTYDRGFCYLDVQTRDVHVPVAPWPYGPVSSLEIFDGREVWVGTEAEGVLRYCLQDSSLQILEREDQRRGSKIHDLHKDQEGNIWVLDNMEGIRSANRRFEFIKKTLQNLQAVLVDHGGQLWLGTQRGLFTLEKEDANQTIFKPHLEGTPLNIISLFEDQFQNLWIGTFGNGLFCYHPSSQQLKQFTEKDGLTNSSILSIDGVNGKVWLATLGGVTEIDSEENILLQNQLATKNYNLEGGLGTNFIYKVFVDSQGRTWFGTDGKGISVLENGTIINYTVAADSLPIRAVYSITEDHRGHIWFSTAKEGLYEFDGKQFLPLGLEHGLRNLSISSLITDSKGNILIIHPSGIDLLDPKTRHLIYFDEAVGISDIDPHLNVVCQGTPGDIWIGARNGVMRYSVLYEALQTTPKVQLRGLSVFLAPVDFQEKNQFAYNENNLIFDYVGLWYTDPASVKYKYILQGFDLDWIESRDQQVTYSNLPPGDYAFKLTTVGNIASEKADYVYEFKVKRPFWQQWWFIIPVVLGGSLLIFWFIQQRERRIQRETLLKKEKVESQFEALKSQINPHFLFNSFNTLITIIEENPEVAVAYVEKLSDFYRSIIQYRKKDVIALQEEIELVNHYAFLLEKRYGSNLSLVIHAETDTINGLVAPLTLQILVENAIKHNVISKSKPLNIDIAIEKAFIKVSNNLQKKWTTVPSTGFGLQSIVNRYALLTDKKVKIEETETAFNVWVPLIKNEKL